MWPKREIGEDEDEVGVSEGRWMGPRRGEYDRGGKWVRSKRLVDVVDEN